MCDRRISLFELAIRNHVRDFMASDEFKSFIRTRMCWALQGYEPGFGGDQREAFTATVAKRIRSKARSHRVRLFGLPLWLARYPIEWCEERAEQMVTDFLKDNRIKFGDPRFDWSDGDAVADEEMSYWESVA